jgi:hypothetical protein
MKLAAHSRFLIREDLLAAMLRQHRAFRLEVWQLSLTGGPEMVASERDRIIRGCSDLVPGTEIEAWNHGRLIHHGRVSQTVPSMGMFWIIDARNGTRRLLDAAAFDVARLDAPATGPEYLP